VHFDQPGSADRFGPGLGVVPGGGIFGGRSDDAAETIDSRIELSAAGAGARVCGAGSEHGIAGGLSGVASVEGWNQTGLGPGIRDEPVYLVAVGAGAVRGGDDDSFRTGQTRTVAGTRMATAGVCVLV